MESNPTESPRNSLIALLKGALRLAKRAGLLVLPFLRRVLGAVTHTYVLVRLLTGRLIGFCRRERRAVMGQLRSVRRLFAEHGFRGGIATLFAALYAQVNSNRPRFEHATVVAGLLIVFIMVPFWTSRTAALWNGGEFSSALSGVTVSDSAASSAPELTGKTQIALRPYLQVAPDSSSEESANTASSASSPSASSAAVSSQKAAVSSSAASTSSAAPAKKKQKASSVASEEKAMKSVPFSASAQYPGDPFARPECVWYAWGRARAVTGVSIRFESGVSHDARNWLNTVIQTSHVKVVRDRSAVRANAVAVFGHSSEGGGHVLFIESVRRDSSGSPESVTISECNWGSPIPHELTLSWSKFRSRSHGSLAGYIYLD